MKVAARLRAVLRVALALPVYAAYGLFVLVVGWFRLMGRAGDAARLLSSTLSCPSCQTPNELHGRFRCRCGFVFHGAVFHCPSCGSGAAFFACGACGASIPLRSGA